MNRANQKAVVQETNMNLVGIRSLELDYFSTFYSNFATQAAIMIGVIVGSLSQVPGSDNPSNAPYFFVALYWVTSVVTLIAAIHSLVCAVFVQVFGQGLGLRGPLGSMVNAVTGMITEQDQILLWFNVMVFAFGLQCIGMFWIMMDQTNAIITMVIMTIAMYFWYVYAIRLYNMFSWTKEDTAFNDTVDSQKELDDYNPSVMNQLHNTKGSGGGGDGASCGGNLTMKIDKILFGDPWKRYYFVIMSKKPDQIVHYYKDSRQFELSHEKPINKRPIELEGYSLLADARSPPFIMSLLPYDEEDIRKVWKFRTDTESEYKMWIEHFRGALLKTDLGQKIGNKIVITSQSHEAEQEDNL